ncbi:hypothetical protein YC2023_045841 [Brassica napus]
MTKRPLSKIEIEQIIGAERPRLVAPTSRSRLRERPRWVAARGRSESDFLSPGTKMASDFSLSLWTGRSKLRERPRWVAARGRSESELCVSGRENASDFVQSLQRVALDRERPW